MTTNLTPDEKREVFGDFDPDQYADEAEQRWGQTDAYKESARRTARYTKQDWERIKAEAAANTEGFIAAFTGGVPADSDRARALAEEHRQHISRWFYDCSYETQRGLGDMYVADPRFTATYDTGNPGLAQYIRDAIHANADRA
ncbi:TipAS antibiotic-recognition domain-containing protein [Dactylosporangium sp. AC04546]|uniref:TipAS antibiotic-recognition domain-containing protein n=1 Tax=Dactylosporangium sp. AC04546 TaxID=2862460 RepID=UPI001EDFF946|nr:TipAS antibiotic-recognition domain-containing protein [Dactylosporangium sp. AC04546]WVK85170.1 TipAS antibiotic-recognition domain-containing protein [Dactylosporangium sp. AC04546]